MSEQHNEMIKVKTQKLRLKYELKYKKFHNKLDKKCKLMLMGRAKAYSSSCSQTVSLSPAISSQLLLGYHSLMPSCAGFLERRKSRLGPSKSTFNAENFISSLSMSISIGFGTIRSCNVSHSPKSPKNPQNPLFWRSRSLNSASIESQCMTSY